MTKVLIVEDDENHVHSLHLILQNEGYDAVVATDLAQATRQMHPSPSLILLDWMLPDGQGIDYIKQLRRDGHHMPVIFLTARTEVLDKVLGLEMGANDYITKPFEARELLARIRVRLREHERLESNSSADPLKLLQVGPLTIDRAKRVAYFNGQALQLVKKEFDLLTFLSESPERAFSRDEILNKIWGFDVFPTTRTVDTHVLWLRQKTSDALIETVRSVGYRLKVL